MGNFVVFTVVVVAQLLLLQQRDVEKRLTETASAASAATSLLKISHAPFFVSFLRKKETFTKLPLNFGLHLHLYL